MLISVNDGLKANIIGETRENKDIGSETIQLTSDFISCNRNDLKQVNGLLKSLIGLIHIHNTADVSRFMYQDDANPPAFLDTIQQNGLELLRKKATPWLVSLLNKPPQMESPLEEEFLDCISNIISSLCGKIAHGQRISGFILANSGTVQIQETSYSEAELGFQTWGAGILLAKIIDSGELIVKDLNVLELGSGTGLTAIVSGMNGGNTGTTYMTDFHPIVLENAKASVKLNNLKNVHVRKLDWNQCIDPTFEPKSELRQIDFQIIMAADCVFDFSHANLVPKVSKLFLSKDSKARFHVMITYRTQFLKEVCLFENNMILEGWIIEETRLIERSDIDYRYIVYRLPHQKVSGPI